MATQQAKRKGRPPIRLIAKARGETTYNTGKPCVNGHICFRWTSDGSCTECRRIINHNYRLRNIEVCRDRITVHYNNNKKAYIDRSVEWANENPEKRRRIKQAYANSERGKVIKYEGCARRRASKKNATPQWITLEDLVEIRKLYKAAKDISVQTGIKHHVDHIIPLNGGTVSGLHVPWNLQVLVWKENIRKSNRMDLP
jgi:5-methylcytosine-specific restriction endonuclease McrA